MDTDSAGSSSLYKGIPCRTSIGLSRWPGADNAVEPVHTDELTEKS